jgi:hypothetical protein
VNRVTCRSDRDLRVGASGQRRPPPRRCRAVPRCDAGGNSEAQSVNFTVVFELRDVSHLCCQRSSEDVGRELLQSTASSCENKVWKASPLWEPTKWAHRLLWVAGRSAGRAGVIECSVCSMSVLNEVCGSLKTLGFIQQRLTFWQR